jgi:hypothetical protein
MNRIRNNRGLEASIRSNRGWRVPIDGSVKRSTEWMEQLLWRACFLGGMAEFVIIEVWRLRLDRIDGDGFRSMAQ